MSANKFEEKAREIVDQVLDYSEFVSAISSALEAAYQEGRQSEIAMNELVKIGQEIDREPTDV